MEEKQVQQPLRETSWQQQRRAQEPAGRRPAQGDALRAAAVLQAGGFQSLARPADVLALGALMGNSALHSLLTAAGPSLVQPFSYRPDSRTPQPVPVRTAAPALCGQTDFPAQPTGLEPFPAAALTGGGAWP